MARRKAFLTVGVAVALSLGGVIVAPFASAGVDGSSATQRQSAVQRWASFWRGQSAPTPTAGDSGGCSDVELVFARGTGDVPRPLGILGVPLSRELANRLPGLSVKATGVDYAADFAQSSDGPGATVMTRHVVAVAEACPDTQFVIGGYSQGASVTDIAVNAQGARVLGRGEAIPEELVPRVAAVVVFGNPLSAFAGRALEDASAVYGGKMKSFCGRADTVCGGARNGNIGGGHLSYTSNGAVGQTAEFAAGKVLG